MKTSQQCSTFFSRDLDFYKPTLCHARYCLVYLAVSGKDVAIFVRRVLRQPLFDTEAKRMGVVMRVRPSELTVWRLHATQAEAIAWTK